MTSTTKTSVPRAAATLVLTAVGLAATGALLVDYTRSSPVFCAEGGGCDALRQTAFAHPFGVPLPIFGVVAFVVLAMLGLARGPSARTANLLIAGLGGIIGLALLALQLLLGHLCPYCTAVDTSAVLLAVLAVDRSRSGWDPPEGRGVLLAASFGLATALVAPVLWGRFQIAKVPSVIAEELAKTPKGEVTIVDFVDFECPFCRRMQETIAPVVAAQKDKVHVVRKMVPLTRIHPHALAAAKAACCAELLGKGDAMADALFETKVDDLTTDGCAKLAELLGLPLDTYNTCVSSPDTEARLAKDRHEFDQAAGKGDGLPLMWVGPYKMMGAQDQAAFSQALRQAMTREGS